MNMYFPWYLIDLAYALPASLAEDALAASRSGKPSKESAYVATEWAMSYVNHNVSDCTTPKRHHMKDNERFKAKRRRGARQDIPSC